MSGIDHLSHGGRTRELAAAAGIPEGELLDFSANLNPLGPPAWLAEAVTEGVKRIGVYPDPDAGEARRAAATRYGIGAEHFLFADGADPILLALPRALGAQACIAASPTYSGYLRAAARSRVPLQSFPLDPATGFSLASPASVTLLEKMLETPDGDRPALVFLGAPNNPAGGSLPRDVLTAMASRYPKVFFAIDESFAELSGEDHGLIGCPLANIIVVRSLTKTWAIPGARIGFASADPTVLGKIRAELSAWPVSSFAEAIAVRAMEDTAYAAASAEAVAHFEADFAAALADLLSVRVHRGGANFLLLEFACPELGTHAARSLLRRGIAVRTFSAAEGLDGRFIRIAVRKPEENRRFAAVLTEILDLCADREPDGRLPSPYRGSLS